ncbi:cytochrome P450 [Ceratobasidium sp. AG-I]|nr:cytochrome P450 [Ceratobasidium sp. AG-I]
MAKLHSRFIISSILSTFVVPFVTTWAILLVFRRTSPISSSFVYKLAYGWSWIFYPIAILLHELFSSTVSSRNRKLHMKQLGCHSLIPKVKGRLIGNLDVLLAITRNEANEYCGDIFDQWAKQYGPTFDMNILWAHQIVTVDPSNIKHVVATSFHSFEKGEKLHDMLEGFLGTGIFNSDGDIWKFHRTLARPFFERDRIADPSHFERHTSRLSSLLNSSYTGNTPFDIQDVFSRYTMDFITDFLFGVSSRTMVPPNLVTKDSENLMNAFNELQKAASTRIRIGSNWPLFELFSDRMKGPKQVVDAYIMPIVNAAVDAKSNSSQVQKDGEESPQNMLEYLVSQTEDSYLVRDTLLAFLLAGRDTSASLLTFVTYVLALYPDVCRRLQAEIDETGPEGQSLTADKIRGMRYLRATINETLRLFPPVPFNIRRSTDQPSTLPSVLSQVPGGLYMYPRCSITFSPLHIHRRTDLWGYDAEEFKPERWFAEGSDKVHVSNPFAFLPFNGGPRMCLGQNLAYLLVSHTIISLVREYSWELAPDKQPAKVPAAWRNQPGRKGVEKCWPKSSLTLYSEKGLFITVRQRDNKD